MHQNCFTRSTVIENGIYNLTTKVFIKNTVIRRIAGLRKCNKYAISHNALSCTLYNVHDKALKVRCRSAFAQPFQIMLVQLAAQIFVLVARKLFPIDYCIMF